MHRRASPLDAKRMRHVAATVLVAVLGELDVDGGEQREDVGLDDADHDLHEVDDDEDGDPEHRGAGLAERDDREALQQRLEEQRREDGEGAHDHVTGEHVAEESDGERDESQERREQLDDPHEDVDGNATPSGARLLM